MIAAPKQESFTIKLIYISVARLTTAISAPPKRSRSAMQAKLHEAALAFIHKSKVFDRQTVIKYFERRLLSLLSDMYAVISGYRHFRDLGSHVAGYVDRDSMPGGNTFIGLWHQVENCLSSCEIKLAVSCSAALGI